MALLFGTYHQVAVTNGGSSIRSHLVEPLGADVLIFATYSTEDGCGTAGSSCLSRVLGCLEPARVEWERERTTRELTEVLEATPSWPTLWSVFNTSCRRVVPKSDAESPFRCHQLNEGGNYFLAPVLGNPSLNVLRQLYMQWRSLSMLSTHEAEARSGLRYEWVVWSRLEYVWVAPHPPLEQLAAPTSPQASRCLWVPLEEDYGGLNDRHGLMPRDVAPSYLGRYGRLLEGRLPEVLDCLRTTAVDGSPHTPAMCARTSERYLAAQMAALGTPVCRFPPRAFLGCCQGGAARCYKGGCMHLPWPPPRPRLPDSGNVSWGGTALPAGGLQNGNGGEGWSEGRTSTLSGKYAKELASTVVHASAAMLPGARLVIENASWPPKGFWAAKLRAGPSLRVVVPPEAFAAWSHTVHRQLKTILGLQWTLIRADAAAGAPHGQPSWPAAVASPADGACTRQGPSSLNRTRPAIQPNPAPLPTTVEHPAAARSSKSTPLPIPTPMPTPACWLVREYTPSPWEVWWRRYVSEHPDRSSHWTKGCAALKNQSDHVAAWEAMWNARRTAEGLSAPWPPDTFSYHTVRNTCDTTGQSNGGRVLTVPIEPLVSLLRHPRHHCFNKLSRKFDRQYLLPLWAHELPTKPRRNFFLDLGASLYSSGTGGASQRWFVEAYAARGIVFDRVLAWEAHNMTAQRIFAPVPPHVLDVLSYYNVPVDPTPGAKHNPWRTLTALARPEDMVVVKLDIDNSPIEQLLVEQLMADPALSALVDDFYFEHHVTGSPMMYQGWGRGPTPTQTLRDSYATFTRLRELGIRAHSWV